MTEEIDKMSCEEFQNCLPELIGSGVNLADHPHLRDCDLCRDFLAELESIAEAARQLFPVEEPPDELWERIERKIEREDGDGAPPLLAGDPPLPNPA